MKTPKWMLKLAIYLDLNQESGYAWMKFNQQIADGEILKDEWLEEIRRSWFILVDGKVVYHDFSKWACVERDLDGDIVNASTYIDRILAGIEQKPEWGYDC